MDEMIENLKAYGADIDGAMGRFLDDVELYKTCFSVFLKDEAFKKLEEALFAEDYKNAFEQAHTLKGVAGNMGLTPLYKVLCHFVEALRNNEYSCLQDYNTAICVQLELLKKI